MKAKIKSNHEPLIHIAKKTPVQGWRAGEETYLSDRLT